MSVTTTEKGRVLPSGGESHSTPRSNPAALDLPTPDGQRKALRVSLGAVPDIPATDMEDKSAGQLCHNLLLDEFLAPDTPGQLPHSPNVALGEPGVALVENVLASAELQQRSPLLLPFTLHDEGSPCQQPLNSLICYPPHPGEAYFLTPDAGLQAHAAAVLSRPAPASSPSVSSQISGHGDRQSSPDSELLHKRHFNGVCAVPELNPSLASSAKSGSLSPRAEHRSLADAKSHSHGRRLSQCQTPPVPPPPITQHSTERFEDVIRGYPPLGSAEPPGMLYTGPLREIRHMHDISAVMGSAGVHGNASSVSPCPSPKSCTTTKSAPAALYIPPRGSPPIHESPFQQLMPVPVLHLQSASNGPATTVQGHGHGHGHGGHQHSHSHSHMSAVTGAATPLARAVQNLKQEKRRQGRRQYTRAELLSHRHNAAYRSLTNRFPRIPGVIEPGLGRHVNFELTMGERIQRRKHQIALGKATVGYQNYIRLLPKQRRSPAHPRTPPLNPQLSKRTFEAAVRHWRRALHSYDDPEALLSKRHTSQLPGQVPPPPPPPPPPPRSPTTRNRSFSAGRGRPHGASRPDLNYLGNGHARIPSAAGASPPLPLGDEVLYHQSSSVASTGHTTASAVDYGLAADMVGPHASPTSGPYSDWPYASSGGRGGQHPGAAVDHGHGTGGQSIERRLRSAQMLAAMPHQRVLRPSVSLPSVAAQQAQHPPSHSHGPGHGHGHHHAHAAAGRRIGAATATTTHYPAGPPAALPLPAHAGPRGHSHSHSYHAYSHSQYNQPMRSCHPHMVMHNHGHAPPPPPPPPAHYPPYLVLPGRPHAHAHAHAHSPDHMPWNRAATSAYPAY